MTSVRCRQCRQLLVEGGLSPALDCCQSFDLCYALDEESPPDWIIPHLDKGDWIKGRLDCDKCGAKIGAFNFVSGQRCSCGQSIIPPIFLHRRKIDVHLPATPLTSAESSSMAVTTMTDPWESASGKPMPKGSHRKSQSWHGSVRSTVDLLIGSLMPSRSLANVSVAAPQETACSLTATVFPLLTSDRTGDYPDGLQCPVCLDLLCRPHICYPCRHVFCELCLRLLTDSGSDPREIRCPMCRRYIRCCLPNADVEEEIRSRYPEDCERRLRILIEVKKSGKLPGHGHFRYVHKMFKLFRPPGVTGDLRFYRIWWFCVSPLMSLRPLVNILFFMTIFFFLLFVPGVCLSSYLIDQMKIYGNARLLEPVVDDDDPLESPVTPALVQMFYFFRSAFSSGGLALLTIGVTVCITLFSMVND